jgi:hypothetical protein
VALATFVGTLCEPELSSETIAKYQVPEDKFGTV